LSAWFRHCPGRAWVVPVATVWLPAAPDGRVAGGGGCGRHCLAAAAVRAAVFAVLQGRATAATGGGVVNKRRATARDSESFVEERAMSGDRAPVYLAAVATPGCGAVARSRCRQVICEACVQIATDTHGGAGALSAEATSRRSRTMISRVDFLLPSVVRLQSRRQTRCAVHVSENVLTASRQPQVKYYSCDF